MNTRKDIKFLFLVVLFSSIVSCALAPSTTLANEFTYRLDQEHPTSTYEIKPQQTNLSSIPTTVYLPTVQKEFPLQTIFGVQTRWIASNEEFDRISKLGISWTRKDLYWPIIEGAEGQYNWDKVSDFEQDLIRTSVTHIRTILVINNTPEWARLYPNSECGPIRRDKFKAFGEFVYQVVKRYSSPPFNILYYEIWNEPDIDPALFNYQGTGIGCWGDNNDEFYGGGYYADMLKVVYPRVKSANPNALVLVGGLLLDCDPRGNLSACQQVGNNPKPAKFLEGILRNQGKDYFDGVSFHAYDQYYGSIGQYGIRNWSSSWNTTGPTIIAKSNFLKEVLQKYNAGEKFLMNTESAVLCESCTNDPNYELTKAYYIPQAYSVALSLGLRANLWYSSMGWRNSGLIKPDGTPIQPVYNSYLHARQTLLNSRFVKELNLTNGVKGFEFVRDNTQIWVVWSLDGNSHSVDLPQLPSKITNPEGQLLQPSSSIQITIEPLYIEFSN